MNTLTGHSAHPFDAYFEQMEARIVEAVSGAARIVPAPSPALEAMQLQPFYTARELALRWRFGTDERPRAQTVLDIPEWDLPRRKVGPSRGSVIFELLDVLLYEGTITERERDAVQESRKQQLLHPTPIGRIRRLGDPVYPRPITPPRP